MCCAFRFVKQRLADRSSDDRQQPLLLRGAVWGDAVLLSDGGQLLQELCEQDDGEHSALGLWGNGRAGRQDGEGRQSEGVLHGAVRKRRVQDDVAARRLEAL